MGPCTHVQNFGSECTGYIPLIYSSSATVASVYIIRMKLQLEGGSRLNLSIFLLNRPMQ